MSEDYVLCSLGEAAYSDILELWQRAGLHIRPDGRDSPTAFAKQIASGYQHVMGLRLASPVVEQPSQVSDRAGRVAAAVPGRLVAVILLTHDGRKGWINRLAVDPAHRRRGMAQTLVREAERWFRDEAGLEVWAALIECENAASQSLFASLGYGRGDVVYVSKRTRPDA
jgi:ribosomal protein S18 acetylase RimI-like enzyme